MCYRTTCEIPQPDNGFSSAFMFLGHSTTPPIYWKRYDICHSYSIVTHTPCDQSVSLTRSSSYLPSRTFKKTSKDCSLCKCIWKNFQRRILEISSGSQENLQHFPHPLKAFRYNILKDVLPRKCLGSRIRHHTMASFKWPIIHVQCMDMCWWVSYCMQDECNSPLPFGLGTTTEQRMPFLCAVY